MFKLWDGLKSKYIQSVKTCCETLDSARSYFVTNTQTSYKIPCSKKRSKVK